MQRLVHALLAALVLPAASLVAAPVKAAEVLPTHCIPGDSTSPICHWRKAKVTFFPDGDTIEVVEGGTSYRVRVIGINTMEMTVYSRYRERREGWCHAVEATNRLEDLIAEAGNEVYLAAQDPDSMSGSRYRRSVWTHVDGVWRDLASVLLQEGHALWMPSRQEWAHREYGRQVQQAAKAGRQLWQRDYCGAGPVQDARISMWVNWDADGIDNENLNGEWVHLRNRGTQDISIAGWTFRQSLHSRGVFVFPEGTMIRAGKAVTLHVGSGINSATRFYWDQPVSVFNNVDRRYGQGEGGFLLDPHGDLRAWSFWPCRFRCDDPLVGKVDVRASATSPEYIRVKNVSAKSVNLRGHLLRARPYSYHFLRSTRLAPGESLRLYVMGSPQRNTATTKYWNKSGYMLNDRADTVSLRSYTDIVVDCHRWGDAEAC